MTDTSTETTGLEPTEAEHLHREILALRAELDGLRAELDGLRTELATEVRTERIAVVHPDDGRELIYTDRLPDSIALNVGWLPVDAPNRCKATLAAGDECGGEATVYVTGGGQVTGSFDVQVDTDDDGSSAIGAYITLEHADWSKPDERGHQRKVSDRPYMRIDPTAGVTLRKCHQDIRGQVRFEVPMGGAS
jgi:hypothetical protein